MSKAENILLNHTSISHWDDRPVTKKKVLAAMKEAMEVAYQAGWVESTKSIRGTLSNNNKQTFISDFFGEEK